MNRKSYEIKCFHEENLIALIDYLEKHSFILELDVFACLNTLNYYLHGVQHSLDKEDKKYEKKSNTFKY